MTRRQIVVAVVLLVGLVTGLGLRAQRRALLRQAASKHQNCPVESLEFLPSQRFSVVRGCGRTCTYDVVLAQVRPLGCE